MFRVGGQLCQGLFNFGKQFLVASNDPFDCAGEFCAPNEIVKMPQRRIRAADNLSYVLLASANTSGPKYSWACSSAVTILQVLSRPKKSNSEGSK